MYEQKVSILREVFPEFRIRKGCEFVTFCPSPKCAKHAKDKMKLEVNLISDRFACWRCQYKGITLRLLKDYGFGDARKRFAALIGRRHEEETQDHSVKLPEEYEAVFDRTNTEMSQDAAGWLESLGVPVEVAFQNRVGFCYSGRYRDRMIFPSFDEYGRLNYFTTRHLYESGKYKWLNCESPVKSCIFNEMMIDWSKPIILVESVKSYLKHFSAIENIVCINGKKMNTNYKLFEKIILNEVPKIYVAFDAEADKEALIAMRELYEYGIETHFVKMYDNEQPDDLDSYELLERIENSHEFEKFDVIKSKLRSFTN
jgi:hypothetical protein